MVVGLLAFTYNYPAHCADAAEEREDGRGLGDGVGPENSLSPIAYVITRIAAHPDIAISPPRMFPNLLHFLLADVRYLG